MIVCAGDIEQFSFATPVGVGLISSAINLTKLCLLNPPEFIFFVGTAGSYGEHKVFDIVESRVASNIEHGFLNGEAYTPIDNVVSASTNVSCETIVNCSNYITTSEQKSKEFLKLGLSLENMEFFSIVSVAKELNIPVGGAFIVTNYCNRDAHKDFIKNHAKAKELIEEYVRSKGIVK